MKIVLRWESFAKVKIKDMKEMVGGTMETTWPRDSGNDEGKHTMQQE